MSDLATPDFEALQVDELALLRASAAVLILDPERFTASFYRRVFDAAPGLRALFSGNKQAQQTKLAQMLVALVAGLEDPQALGATLRMMGATHRGYGVKPLHYQVICGALVETLVAAHDTATAPQIRQTWSRLLTWVSREMLRGAQRPVKNPRQEFEPAP